LQQNAFKVSNVNTATLESNDLIENRSCTDLLSCSVWWYFRCGL